MWVRLAVNICLLFAAPLHGQVVIDRVLVDPVGNKNSNAIPEIVNLGNSAVDLTGWTLSLA